MLSTVFVGVNSITLIGRCRGNDGIFGGVIADKSIIVDVITVIDEMDDNGRIGEVEGWSGAPITLIINHL